MHAVALGYSRHPSCLPLRPQSLRPAEHYFRRGECIWQAGQYGPMWRICSGAVRFCQIDADGNESLVGIALAGELIGDETLLDQSYGWHAHALTDCSLERCQEPGSPDHWLHQTLLNRQRQAVLLAMRHGQAISRIKQLLHLLSPIWVGPPRLSDIAAITDLRMETVSRLLKQMRQQGELA